jgi:1,4-alpha-glucan branching enzyme
MGASIGPFMGAIPYSDNNGSGVTARVWALFANAVSVAGDFNHWSGKRWRML